jgi:pilus assembly protein Flp/PilA
MGAGSLLGSPGIKREINMEAVLSVSNRVYLTLAALRDREEGQALVEYALLLSLIAVVSIGILTALGQSVSGIFSSVNSAL